MNGIHSTPEPFGFIQARLGSTRLTGKVLETIPESGNQSLLDHIYLRLRRILPHKNIVFLIPEDDETLAIFLEGRQYQYFKGSLDDVRDRYIKAAEFYNAEHIIRLTGDNPFIDITSIELLWEAMFYIKEKNYCLSIQGLPIGMGVECFTYSALIQNIQKYNEPRHKEHVSLHIKENLSENRVYRLIPPHLSDIEIQNSSNIRMTIDTTLDLSMLREVWDYFGKTNPFFGAKEVIDLFKKSNKMFAMNKDVEQVRFDLPSEKNSRKQISLTYGNPTQFGSGHFERCKTLSIELQIAGFDIHCNSELNHNFDGYIVDARETAPVAYPALSIDNISNADENITHVYLLPHPDISSSEKDDISFYCSPFIDLHKKNHSQIGQWLIYCGSLDKVTSDKIDDFFIHFLLPKWKIKSLIRVGGSPPNSNDIQYFSRLTKYEYYELLSKSEGFVSYFGQSIMESLYLKKRTVLFGISEIHKRLGIFLANKMDLTYIGEPDNFRIPDENPNENITKNILRNAQYPIKQWLNSI